MESAQNVEEVEAVCSRELLSVFEEAYARKVQAFARWWHETDEGKSPKGGRHYDTFRDFVIDSIKHQAGQFQDGPFLTYDEMHRATAQLSSNPAVLAVAPRGVPTHVNVRWFKMAARMFLESLRFSGKPDDLKGLSMYYRSQVGLYFVE